MPAGAEKGKAATKTDWTINFTTTRRRAAARWSEIRYRGADNEYERDSKERKGATNE